MDNYPRRPCSTRHYLGMRTVRSKDRGSGHKGKLRVDGVPAGRVTTLVYAQVRSWDRGSGHKGTILQLEASPAPRHCFGDDDI